MNDHSPVLHFAAGCDVLDPERDQVATSQFAVDGEIEQREVSHATAEFKPGADRPDLLHLQGGFLPCELPGGDAPSATGRFGENR